MSDRRLRALERAWLESGAEADRARYAAEVERLGLAPPFSLLASSDRWSRHVSLVAKWYPRALVESDGFDPVDVQRAEERLGVQLPVALREAYLLFGRRDDILGREREPPKQSDDSPIKTASKLVHPSELVWDWRLPDYLVFNTSEFSHTPRAVRRSDAVLPDPPVLQQVSSFEATPYQVTSPTFSEFLLAQLVARLAFSGMSFAESEPDVSSYPRLPVPSWSEFGGEVKMVLYGDADTVIVLQGDDLGVEYGYAAARTPEALQALRRSDPEWT